MEKNCDMTGEMGNHLPTKQPKEASSEGPVAAKPFPNDAYWVDLFVKEITSASDSDNARICAAKALKSFEQYLQKCLISEVKQNLLERAKTIALEDEKDMQFYVGSDGSINYCSFGRPDDVDEDKK